MSVEVTTQLVEAAQQISRGFYAGCWVLGCSIALAGWLIGAAIYWGRK